MRIVHTSHPHVARMGRAGRTYPTLLLLCALLGIALFTIRAVRHLGWAVPGTLRLGALLHGAMPLTDGCLRGLHRTVACWCVGAEPLGRVLDLRLDAGEVHTAQGDQHLIAMQGGFQRNADRCLWQWRGGYWRLC